MVLQNLPQVWPSAATAAVSWVMLLLLLLQPVPVAADCECGYSTTMTINSSDLVFADLLESDFTRVNYFDDGYNGSRRWARQAFTKSAGAARGPFGEAYVMGNAMSDIAAKTTTPTTTKNIKAGGNNDNGAGTGLELLVGGKVVDGMVQNAEIATTELDYFYGTYRVGLKVTNVPGTCTAFFWYFNDTQEIDIEFLSHEFNHTNQSYPVNLVLQTAQSRAAGYDASRSGTGTFQKHDLPFDPTASFHEYRFDFLVDRVVFYADGAVLATMVGGDGSSGVGSGIPSRGGNLLLSHWSNGNPGWSAGPPAADARSVVSYVKAYFNSSDAARGSEARSRCEKAPAGKNSVCKIPEGNRGFFFSDPGSGDSQSSGGGSSGTGANGQGNSGGDGHHSAACLATATGRLVPLVLTVALGATIWIAGR